MFELFFEKDQETKTFRVLQGRFAPNDKPVLCLLQSAVMKREQERLEIFFKSVFFFFQEANEIERASSKRPNPHKYLLYKPTLSQLHVFLACGVKVCILVTLMQAKCISLFRYLFARLVQFNKRLISLPENAKVGPGLDILAKDWPHFRILKSLFHTLLSHGPSQSNSVHHIFYTDLSFTCLCSFIPFN